MMRERELFIGGAWRRQKAAGGSKSATPPPASGSGRQRWPTPLTSISPSPRPSARLPGWAEMHADARAGILHRAADLIVERTAAIADLLTREQGKPIPDAEKEIRFGVEVIRYYAEEGRRLGGAIRASSRMDIRSLVVSSPVGVVGAITPWNYPVDIYAWKLGPALAAGCSLVVKPPHETPLAVGMIAQCFADAGLPARGSQRCAGDGTGSRRRAGVPSRRPDDHGDRLDLRRPINDAGGGETR